MRVFFKERMILPKPSSPLTSNLFFFKKSFLSLPSCLADRASLLTVDRIVAAISPDMIAHKCRFLVGTKSDRLDQHKDRDASLHSSAASIDEHRPFMAVSNTEARTKADELNAQLVQCSAYTGANVPLLFSLIAKAVYEDSIRSPSPSRSHQHSPNKAAGNTSLYSCGSQRSTTDTQSPPRLRSCPSLPSHSAIRTASGMNPSPNTTPSCNSPSTCLTAGPRATDAESNRHVLYVKSPSSPPPPVKSLTCFDMFSAAYTHFIKDFLGQCLEENGNGPDPFEFQESGIATYSEMHEKKAQQITQPREQSNSPSNKADGDESKAAPATIEVIHEQTSSLSPSARGSHRRPRSTESFNTMSLHTSSILFNHSDYLETSFV